MSALASTAGARLTALLALLRAREWLLIVCVVTFLMYAGFGLVSPILPLYARDFGVSTTMVGLLITIFGIARGLSNVPAGRAGERWGRRSLLILGPLITGLASLLVAAAPNFGLLLLGRALQGVGSGLQMTGGYMAVADLSPPAERGRSSSLYQGSLLVGLSFGPMLGGLLAGAYGYRVPFLAYALLALAAAAWAWWRFPESRGQADRRPARAGVKEISGVGELLRRRDFLLIALVAFAIFFSRTGGRFTVLPLFGFETLGLSEAQLGLVFSLVTMLNLVLLFPGGYLTDRWGRKRTIVPGLLLTAAAFSWMGESSSFSELLLASVLMGLAAGIGHAAPAAYVVDIASPRTYGVTMGTYRTVGDVGVLAGPVVLGWLADRGGLALPFHVSAVLLAVTALLFALLAKETGGQTEQPDRSPAPAPETVTR